MKETITNRALKQRLKFLADSILNSYAQVFFSKNRLFAVILMLVSFFDVYAGISGLIAVFTANGIAWFMGINRQKIIAGAYGFNPLMVGLGFGLYFQPGLPFYIILIFISLLTLFITLGFEGVLGKYGLPYLSIPFLFGIWMILIAAKSYGGLYLSERGVYTLNDLYAFGGMNLVKVYNWFDGLNVAEPLRIYLKSLSAIFFQYHIFAGMLIALGLILYSRIAFTFSLIGFFAAYYFYLVIGANISELSYSYIGFNYILTAIAVGGFFIVPSKRSLLWVLLLTPVVAIIMTSTSYLFSYYQLSIFSLPFNITALLFLYSLKFREKNFGKLTPVVYQQFSPELNVYGHKNYMERFGGLPYVFIKFPFWGEWKVTQAFEGSKSTHRDNWKYAWDFEIFDEYGMNFKNNGTKPEDYLCYNKPLSAPADGIVVELEDGIDDNRIGGVNINKNWGNSIVIKHAEYLYSQISHIKKGSFKVKKGDVVKQGDLLAYAGNSGRSPVPHIHFQIQSTPQIGSKTIRYPVSSYILKTENGFVFKTASYPKLDDSVSNVSVNENLKKAFGFVPGETLTFETVKNNIKKEVNWEVKADIYNNTYIRCKQSGATAYFKFIGEVFYFTGYKGKKETLLYYFYLSSFKSVTAFYKNLVISDNIPLNMFPEKSLLLLQDFIIPVYKFLFAKYSMVYSAMKENIDETTVDLKSTATFGVFGKNTKKYQFSLIIKNSRIEQIGVKSDNKQILKAVRR